MVETTLVRLNKVGGVVAQVQPFRAPSFTFCSLKAKIRPKNVKKKRNLYIIWIRLNMYHLVQVQFWFIWISLNKFIIWFGFSFDSFRLYHIQIDGILKINVKSRHFDLGSFQSVNISYNKFVLQKRKNNFKGKIELMSV